MPVEAYREQLYCLGKDFIVWGTTLFVVNNRTSLEQLEFDGQVFFRVLAEVVDEFDGLG
jgi:hypothetical protein